MTNESHIVSAESAGGEGVALSEDERVDLANQVAHLVWPGSWWSGNSARYDAVRSRRRAVARESVDLVLTARAGAADTLRQAVEAESRNPPAAFNDEAKAGWSIAMARVVTLLDGTAPDLRRVLDENA